MCKRHLCLVLFVIVAATAASCDFVPNFSNTPRIEFRDIYRVPIPPTPEAPGIRDTLFIVLFFQDGDGDLGLGENTTQFDFFANAFKQVNGQYIPFQSSISSQLGFNGTLPRLVENARPGPIEGTVTYRLTIESLTDLDRRFDIQPNDTLRFDIYVTDRAGNRSNTITTDPVIVLLR
ncbi:MAG: hypothetical protein MUD08_01775 [Cytophagales bacterium]|nr:hypothetical protein [Cytophagales bacterium]